MRDAGGVSRAISELKSRFGARVETGEAVRAAHANTLTWIKAEPPDAVVWPLSTEEVAGIVEIAARHRVPLIPFGAGTSLEGHVNAPLGGISVDLSRMTRILAVSPRDLDCTVEAGVTRGYVFEPATTQFVAADNTRRSDAALRALAGTAGQEVTYTCTPPGSGQRIAYGS